MTTPNFPSFPDGISSAAIEHPGCCGMGAALAGADSPISRIGIAAGVWVCPRRDLAGCSPATF